MLALSSFLVVPSIDHIEDPLKGKFSEAIIKASRGDSRINNRNRGASRAGKICWVRFSRNIEKVSSVACYHKDCSLCVNLQNKSSRL